MKDAHTKIFNHYFHSAFWGNADGTSGPNSAFHLTHKLRANIQNLLSGRNIHSIVDIGCGDANLFRYIDLTGIEYSGLECVPALTQQNQVQFADRPNMTFQTTDVIYDPVPQAELVICRDVVHYLPNELIFDLLENIKRSQSTYLLITHNLFSPDSANVKTNVGIFRPVNLTQAPFNWPQPIEIVEEDEFEFGKALGLWKLI